MQSKENNFQKCLYPWLILSLSIAFLLYRFLLQISPAAANNSFVAFYRIESHWSYLSYLCVYTYLIIQCLFSGILVDRFGVRIFTSTAIVCCAIGVLMFAVSGTLTSANISRLIMGAGLSFATVSYLKIAGDWFDPKKFATLAGLLTSAGVFGYVYEAAPVLTTILNFSWQESLIIFAIIGFILAALFALLARNNAKKFLQFSFTDVKEVLKNPQNFMLAIYSGLAFAPIIAFCGFWGKPYLKEAYHVDANQVTYLLTCLLIGIACGGPVIGFFSDRIKRRRIFMLFGILIQEFTFIALAYLQGLPFWLSAALMCVFGFASGAFMLSFVIGKQNNKDSVTATVSALINTGIAAIAVFTEALMSKFLYIEWDGNLINGVQHFSVFDYHVAFIILPVYLLIAFILLLFIKEASEL